ncbi:MAG: cytochrome c3 family protein [Candidatus Tectomicrobia bacterium]|uniref:Cytochrome c3 family protein n=1 Tax=Tectimicrobiota bacterium TaxID=2528274 RepID=A0A932HVV0_UNCTE|nr:cytochrome c3 family protein [Candidatus Tectomicrobia bacterium]
MHSWRLWTLAAVAGFAVFFSTVAGYGQMPVPPDITFKQTKDFTPTVFSHKIHAAKNPDCTACHPQIFPMKAGGTLEGKPIPLADMMAGKYCGTCHNGQKAFLMTDCVKCHPPKK